MRRPQSATSAPLVGCAEVSRSSSTNGTSTSTVQATAHVAAAPTAPLFAFSRCTVALPPFSPFLPLLPVRPLPTAGLRCPVVRLRCPLLQARTLGPGATGCNAARPAGAAAKQQSSAPPHAAAPAPAIGNVPAAELRSLPFCLQPCTSAGSVQRPGVHEAFASFSGLGVAACCAPKSAH